MPLSLFCSSCGTKSYYTTRKPGFCAGCGKPFEVSASELPTNRPEPEITRKPRRRAEAEEDVDFVEEIPNVDSIKVELNIEGSNAIKWNPNEDRQTSRRRLQGRLGAGVPTAQAVADPMFGVSRGKSKESPEQVLAKLKQESISNRAPTDVTPGS